MNEMSEWPINPFDALVAVIIIISAILALIRGLTHEVLSVVAWIGAAIATLFLFPYARPLSGQYIETGWIADILTAVVIFVAITVILSFLSHAISKGIKDSPVGPLDHTLGFLFGVARGGVLIVVLFLGLQWYLGKDPYPQWIANGRTLPLVAAGADMLRGILPGDGNELPDFDRTMQHLQNPVSGDAASPDNDAGTGYKSTQRRALDQLIQSNKAAD